MYVLLHGLLHQLRPYRPFTVSKVFETLVSIILIMSLATVYLGLGARNDPKILNNLLRQFKTTLTGILLWLTAVTFVRASIILLYIRIFRTPYFRTICYVVHGINMAYYVAVFLSLFLICRPLAYNWNHELRGACGDQESLELFIGIFNLLLDVMTVALPMPVLWGLQMATSKKMVLTGMFSLGLAYAFPWSDIGKEPFLITRRICAITLARIKVTSEINRENIQLKYATIAMLTCLEALLGVVNSCLPVMKPIFNKLRQTQALAFLSSWNSTWRGSKRNHMSLSGGDDIRSARSRKSWPASSRSKAIVHKDSYQMHSREAPSKFGNAISLDRELPPTPVSKSNHPAILEDQESLEQSDRIVVRVDTTWDVEHRASEDKLPIYPSRRYSGMNGRDRYL